MPVPLVLFLLFFQIGLVGFGGGYAMIAMIFTESARAVGLSAAEFAQLSALDLVIPGPIAINAATYVGFLKGGLPGALLASLGVSLASFVYVPAAMAFLDRFQHSRILQYGMAGAKAGAVGLILSAAWLLATGAFLRDGAAWASFMERPLETVSPGAVVLFAVCLVSILRFKVHPILVTLGAGMAGAILLR